jgi:hypothetical protein
MLAQVGCLAMKPAFFQLVLSCPHLHLSVGVSGLAAAVWSILPARRLGVTASAASSGVALDAT